MKESILKFDANALSKKIFNSLVAEQTQRLIDYAKETILEIGNKIQTYNSENHMDRTGNLLNSLCWGVAYDGKLIESGYYRDANSIEESYLHEWSKEFRGTFVVDGHMEAANYIKRYGAQGSGNGYWRVFFAILAPYWGYWEEGFMLDGQRLHFNVMSQFYDKVTKELKPSKVHYHVTKSIQYSKGWDYTNRKGKKVHVMGTLDKWLENGVHQSRRGKRKKI